MKGEKVRVAIIYILVVVIILLVGYLIYNFVVNNKEETPKEEVKVSDVASECTFDISINDYSAIASGNNANLCGGLNKLKINDIILNGNKINAYIIYQNGDINENDNTTGVYINDKRILKLASKNYINNIGIFDNKLFIYAANQDKPNVVVYDQYGKKVYDLETALSRANVSDPAFVELAKTNTNLNVTVRNSSINVNSFTFGPNEFTFGTAFKGECTPGTNIGSNYKVTFSENNFSAPEFVSFNVCNG